MLIEKAEVSSLVFTVYYDKHRSAPTLNLEKIGNERIELYHLDVSIEL